MIDTHRRTRIGLALGTFLALTCAFTTKLAAQQPLIASATTEADLPDAPTMREPQQPPRNQPSPLPATVTGVVSDIRGALVPGASIKLSAKGSSESQTATSDGDGDFSFTGVAPGSYTVTISSPGLETFRSPVILLRPGQYYLLPAIALPIAPASTTVEVVVTQSEVADEQVAAEVQQRILSIVPNFYTSFIWNAAPLNTRQKFKISFRSIIDPTVFLG
ncbi:MAG: carboxypeptidase-like regulatory domain-containing protein, partial [Acidobacteriaceae bacterium]